MTDNWKKDYTKNCSLLLTAIVRNH